MYGWLNIGSLILGLIAWILPIASLAKHNKDNNKAMYLIKQSVILMDVSLNKK